MREQLGGLLRSQREDQQRLQFVGVDIFSFEDGFPAGIEKSKVQQIEFVDLENPACF